MNAAIARREVRAAILLACSIAAIEQAACTTTAVSVSGLELRAHAAEFRRAGAAVVRVSPAGTRRLLADRVLSLHVDRVIVSVPIAQLVEGCDTRAPDATPTVGQPAVTTISEQPRCMLDGADAQDFVLETSHHLDGHAIARSAELGAALVVPMAPVLCAIECAPGPLETTSEVVAIAEGVGVLALIIAAYSTANWGFF